MVSLRGLNRHAAWCSNYEFEDVICEVDDVDLLAPSPGAIHDLRRWLARRLIWRPGLSRIPMNPGLKPMTLQNEYDLCVFVCMNLSDLIYLRGVQGWKDRCKTSVCIVVEFYGNWIREYANHLRLLEAFDQTFFCFSNCVDPVQKVIGKPCVHLPLAADVLRFTPYPNPPKRTIDVYSMGRRSESAHQALLEMAGRGEIFYIHDTIPGGMIQPPDHVAHRNLVANLAKRSRLFVAYPAKVGREEDTRGESEVGARFFEGAASGAVMIGQAPTIPTFQQDFNWPDAVIDLGSDTTELKHRLGEYLGDPERMHAMSRKNASEALLHFDWVYRWKEVLARVGLAPTERLLRRERRLLELADIAGGDTLRSIS